MDTGKETQSAETAVPQSAWSASATQATEAAECSPTEAAGPTGLSVSVA